MTFRINVNSCKNAMGTVFLLAAAFFVCSTFISMRSVFADPIAPANTLPQRSGRTSPRATATSRATTARTTASRATTSRASVAPQTVSRSAASRAGGATNRIVSSRGTASGRNVNSNSVSTRGVTSRGQNIASARTNTSNRAVRARTASTPSRVSVNSSVMAGSRAGTTNYAYLTSSLYTGTYSNIIDSTTGLISADAYSNCMESYYTCMDEICTARSDTKGRCSCAGRAVNFLESEEALEKANEELIKLSGQLTLLIATKGKGDDLAAAFSLTDAEKVMNCVSWKEMTAQYGTNWSTSEVQDWCKQHGMYDSASCKQPDYCKTSGTNGNNFGFNIDDINGSSSNILAQLKSWADAKDLAKEYTINDNDELFGKYTTVAGVVDGLTGVTETNKTDLSLDSLANKWGYDLFQYAHNNVCGRVLDSCFNGIYEACGTPNAIKKGETTVRIKCANGATSKCPFNYNSYVSVSSDGEVILSDRSNANATVSTSDASCFGYSGSTTTTRNGVAVTTTDPYATLRGPVADARRSIMQKYLLDANAACDTYGIALKNTAQNINYQKIAAEQALQQKRLEFKQEEETTTFSAATAAIDNFNECISEIWDCYDEYADEEKWTTARIKAYCSQVSQVPHCYETMICSPLQTQLVAVVDKPDSDRCTLSNDYTETTCRNVVTINEILYGATKDSGVSDALDNWDGIRQNGLNSAKIREMCLQKALGCGPNAEALGSDETPYCLRRWNKTDKGEVSANWQKTTITDEDLSYATSCTPADEYATKGRFIDGKCLITECTEGTGLKPNDKASKCVCADSQVFDENTNECTDVVKACTSEELSVLDDSNATGGHKVWNYSTKTYNPCVITKCKTNYKPNEAGTACVAINTPDE